MVLDLGLPPYDPQAADKPYKRQNCTDQYDARMMGHHALDSGMFDVFDADEMGGESDSATGDAQEIAGKEEYNAGVIAYERGDLDEAASLFMKAISKAPNAGPARNNLAIVLFQQGDKEAALEQLKRLVDDHPDQAGVLRNYGVALWLSGRSREALTMLDRGVEADGTNAEFHFLRSRILDGLGEREGMIEAMRKAVEVEPDNAAAHDNLGVVLQNAQMLEEAIKQFRMAHSLEPSNPLPLYNLGQALYAADQNVEATEMLLAHLKLRPEHSCAHYELAKCLSDEGRHTDALEHFKTYNELEPTDPMGVCSVGTELGLCGEFEPAEKTIRRSLEIEPAYHWAVHALGMLYRRAEKWHWAAAFHAEAMRRDKDYVGYKRAYIEALYHIKPLDEIIVIVRAMPGDGAAPVWLRLMTRLREDERSAEAVAIGLIAVAVHPKESALMGTLALAQDDMGDRTEALATLRKTTTLNPDDLIAHFHAGRILAETEQWAKARGALEYVAERDLNGVAPREYLLFCYANLEMYEKCDQMAEEILRLDPENAYIKEMFEKMNDGGHDKDDDADEDDGPEPEGEADPGRRPRSGG